MPSAIDRSAVRALAVCLVAALPASALARDPAPAEPARQGPEADYPLVIGEPFTVEGTTYVPRDTLNYDAVGYAELGAGGNVVTGAHRTLPLPCYVEVTSLASGRTILVRLTQRGPMSGSNLVALSPGAWAQLGLADGASAPVRVRRVNPPEAERALLRGGQRAPERMETPPGLLSVLKRKLGPSGNTVLNEGPRTAASPAAPEAAPATPKPAPAAAPKSDKLKPAGKPVIPPAPKVAKADTAAAPPPPPAPPAAKSADTVKTSPEPGKTRGLFVQVGAYSSEDRARAVASRSGARIMRAGKVWRVRMGPYADQAEADRALAKARGAGYGDSRIVREP